MGKGERAARRSLLLLAFVALIYATLDPRGAEAVSDVARLLCLTLGALTLVWVFVLLVRMRRAGHSTPPDPTLDLETSDRSFVRRAWRSREPVPERLRAYVSQYAETQIVPNERALWAMTAMCILTTTNVFNPGALRIFNLATLGFVVAGTLGLELAVARWQYIWRSATDGRASEAKPT